MDYKICTRCVMDTIANDIIFDASGVCNYCKDFEDKKNKHIPSSNEELLSRSTKLVELVKKTGKGEYDCVVGVSGGVDSSWALVKACEMGLRPLAVHMDSGWNSELAQNNISNLVTKLGLELHTHVIEWHEIRGLMEAFFASDVIDVEVLYDNAMLAVNYQIAKDLGVKYILSGTNIATEGVDIPYNWNWYKSDKRNIISISKAFGGPKLKSFPSISTLQTAKYVIVDRIKWISFLDYCDYNKSEAVKVLTSDYGYKPYPYKHYESVFTRFFQGYILPNKFNVDKRKPHLSSLVMNNEMSRSEALDMLKEIPYESQRAMDEDKKYFIKKMGWTEEKFDQYISRPEISHLQYGSERPLYDRLLKIYRKNGFKFGRIKW